MKWLEIRLYILFCIWHFISLYIVKIFSMLLNIVIHHPFNEYMVLTIRMYYHLLSNPLLLICSQFSHKYKNHCTASILYPF